MSWPFFSPNAHAPRFSVSSKYYRANLPFFSSFCYSFALSEFHLLVYKYSYDK